MLRRPGWFGPIAVATILSGAFACRQIAGITDNPPEALTSTACGLPYGTTECASCVANSCCPESTACAADPAGCGAFEGCLGRCSGDPGCRSQCFIDHPGYVASGVPALGACLASKCEGACDLTCGGGAPSGGISPDMAAACDTCFAATPSVCTNARKCSTSADCTALAMCVLACRVPDCRQTCAVVHDASLALYGSLGSDFVGTCSSQCGAGRNWSCVGHVSWPNAKSATIAMTTFVGLGADETPVPGAEVSLSQYCPPSAEAGAPALASGVTDDAGIVSFPVALQVANAGPGSGHGLDGCITATKPGFLTTLWYWGFPLTQPAVGWVPTPVFNATETGNFVPVITPTDVILLNMNAGTTPDPTRGVVGAFILDCNQWEAPDVTVTLGTDDPAVRALYGTSFSATVRMTDTSGEVFFVNVPTGTLTLTATPVTLMKPSSVVTVNVQASTFTEVLMYPTP